MFERFSEEARRAIFFARYEASQLGGGVIDPEHVLLALLREPGLAREILANVQTAADELRLELRRAPSTSVEIPFSAPTKRVLNTAAEEADLLVHATIHPEHLLLALLREESSRAASLLRDHHITADGVRRELGRGGGNTRDLRLHMPDVLRSHRAHRVRIWPSARPEGGMDEGGMSHWLLEGFTLRAALSRACALSEAHIELPASCDGGQRYDFLLTGHLHDDPRQRGASMRSGIEAHFNLTTEIVKWPADVYVMTAPSGLMARELEEDGGGGFFGSAAYTIGSGGEAQPVWSVIGPISGPVPMDVFCQLLGSILGRPVMNETGLSGTYELELPEVAGGLQQWFYALEEKLGLRLTADLRDMDVLLVRERST